MKSKFIIIVRIIVPIFTIINSALVILFFFTYINRCSYIELISKIKKELKDNEKELKEYTDIFCSYDTKIFIWILGIIILYFCNIIYLISLIIDFITFLVSLCGKRKGCLKAAIGIFFGQISISILDLIVVLIDLKSLNNNSNLPQELKKEIEESYETVKERRIRLIVYTAFSVIISLFCGIMSSLLLKKIQFNNNDLNQKMNQSNSYIINNSQVYTEQNYGNQTIYSENLYVQNNN